mmetsp:Transcript_8935/g.17852  ORF Transcript_8935/g.17852 Transcript_8935/m.17852 type:complete len:240 (-) Transcript_8935:254-973(-)
MPVTRTSLSVGVERARTRSFGQISSIRSWMMCFSGFSAFCSLSTSDRNCSPVIAFSSPLASFAASRIPALREIALAVERLSPVTMRTTMPAALQTSMECGTSSRSGSSIPTMFTSVRFASRSSASWPSASTGEASKSRYATAIVRSPISAIALIAASTSFLTASSTGTTFPSPSMYVSHNAITISEAPLHSSRHLDPPPGMSTRVDMRLRLEEKEMDDSFLYVTRIFRYGIALSPGSPW